MTQFFASLLVGASVFLFVYVFFNERTRVFLSPSKRLEERISRRIRYGRSEEIEALIKGEKKERPLVSPSTVRTFVSLADRSSLIKRTVFSPGIIQNIDNMLVWAGRPNNLDAVSFIVLWFLVAAGGLLFALVVFLLFGSNKLMGFLGVLAFVFLAVSPWAYLQREVKRRQDRILSALPDKLDLMRVCIEAGMTVDASIESISHGDDPLDKELRILSNELSLAKTSEEKRRAYWEFSNRCGLPEVEQVVQFLLHSQEIGQPPGETLQKLSEMARFNRQNYVTRVIEVLPNKIVFPLVCCFLPAFFLVFVTPLFLRLLSNL
ncbi:MAG: type II secretion system F family protein [Candidatus Hadarchaeales archaeon]